MTVRPHIFCILAVALLLWPHAAGAGPAIIRDAEIEDTLKTYGRPIFEEAGLSSAAVRFVIVQENEMNAFVAGGQNIFLNTGLMLDTKKPDELIGVIAHETGHIAGGHLFRTQEVVDNLTMEMLLAQIFGIAAAAGAKSGDAGMAIGTAGSALAQRIMLRHSRMQESAADQGGVRFLQAAGLPLGGFLSFMQTLASQDMLPESQQVQYVRTHPLSQDRVDFLANTIKDHPDRGAVPAGWDERHRRLKAKLTGYLFPDRALQDKGDSIASRYGRAIATYRRGKMADAVTQMDALLKAEPQNPYFHELKAQILFESGHVDQSLPSYAAAVRLAPKSALIRGAYGHALLEDTKNPTASVAEAVTQLSRAIDDEPRQSDLRHYLGIAYGKQGREGLSRLSLAEEAVLQGKDDFAHLQATLAQKALPKNSAGWLRADDVLEQVNRRKGAKKR